MNKIQVTLIVLTSMVVGTTLPLDLKRGIKDKGKHLVRCLQGKEPCSKTDFALLGISLLFLHSSFNAALHIGKSVYKPEEENHHDKIETLDREGSIGHYSRKLNRLLRWTSPGRLPETVVRVLRKKRARTAQNVSDVQMR